MNGKHCAVESGSPTAFTPHEISRVIEEVAWGRGYDAGWKAAILQLECHRNRSRIPQISKDCLFCEGKGILVCEQDMDCPVCCGTGLNRTPRP